MSFREGDMGDDLFKSLESESNVVNPIDDDDDWGVVLGDDGEYHEETYSEEVDYTTYENKVVRIFTKGIEFLSKGSKSDLFGDICIVDKYHEETEIFEIEKLGKREKLKIEKKFIDKITGVRLLDDVKEEVKAYRKSHRDMVRGIRYILRSKVKETDLLEEISRLLYEIGEIAEETYEPIIDREDPHGDYNTFGGIGGYGNYKSSFNDRDRDRDRDRNRNSQGNGYFGNNNSMNDFDRNNNNFGRNNEFNNSRSRNNNINLDNKELKDSEGLGLFKKDIFGKEKAVYERSKNGKKKKKPTMLMRAGRTYYVKLNTKEMMLVYVKQEEIRKGVYEKYYYSEYGLVEAREIAWFREKSSSERGTQKIKDNYRRVFVIERQLEKLYSKMEEKDIEVKSHEKLKNYRRERLHLMIVRDCTRGEILYQSKSKIKLGVIAEKGIKYIVIKGIEEKFAIAIYKKYKNSISKIIYRRENKILMLPLIRGVRRAEVDSLIEDCIKVYGNGEKRVVRLDKKDILLKHMDKGLRVIDKTEAEDEEEF